MKEVTSVLQSANIRYRWGFPFKLRVPHNGTTYTITTIAEGKELLVKLGLLDALFSYLGHPTSQKRSSESTMRLTALFIFTVFIFLCLFSVPFSRLRTKDHSRHALKHPDSPSSSQNSGRVRLTVPPLYTVWGLLASHQWCPSWWAPHRYLNTITVISIYAESTDSRD